MNLNEEDIAQYFGSIGVIKNDKRTGKVYFIRLWNIRPCKNQNCDPVNLILNTSLTSQAKIWIYKDRNTGEQKGEATVTYDDPQAAQSAISWFDGKVSCLQFYILLFLYNVHSIKNLTKLLLTLNTLSGF